MKYLCWLLLLGLVRNGAAQAPAAANQALTGFRNPVISGMNPDPSVCRVGDDFYAVTSTFSWYPGVPIYHSKDLINWEMLGYCLTTASGVDLTKGSGIYAPTLRYANGTFYLVTTNQRNGGNFIVTAKNPAGPWSKAVWVKEIPGIDPSLFFDADGKAYFTATHPDGIVQSEIDVATGKLLTAPKIIWAGTGGRYPEGPHLYKVGKYYYLMISEGGTEYGHMVNIARSASPWGPFETDPANPILTHRNKNAQSNPIQGTGHADMVQAPNGSWWMLFLAFRQNGSHHHLGRETFLTPFTWTAQGWPELPNGGTTSLVVPGPTLPLRPFAPLPARDEFAPAGLPLHWNFLKRSDSTAWSLSERPGWLRLKGQAGGLNDGTMSGLIARRQQHLTCTATTTLDFDPKTENEEAGLTAYHRGSGHYDVFIQKQGKQRFVVLRYKVGSISHEEKRVALAKGPVRLQISTTPQEYSFAFAQNDGAFQPLGTVETRFISSETVGGFVGVFLGVYATGNGQRSTDYADFDWFDYAGQE